ncbi:MAG: dipeptide/oligopeptide/nickel ABC transporter ATP-binding protein [Eggerthellaceae bacterium]|jgi:peptide/nickel transport system ATP-binding protein|nr:dipeptide/oligopeptide/nickel ABC transporter ATP-binding protein [Eggerthellaceae bacterium]MCH4220423.1 dipeptide/oligopeptide/nickel ABC transporter ATP-binding protein [Eggerthellaceae bacterium]
MAANDTHSDAPLLEVRHLSLLYGRKQTVSAVNDVSFRINEGESLALVGESGAGKSSVARVVCLLANPTSGLLLWKGHPIDAACRHDLRRHIQMVAQDPMCAFDPAWTIGRTLSEPLINFGICHADDVHDRVSDLLEHVQLSSSFIERKPGELSGGQLQRVAIARALASNPELLILDEATSALDMTVQEQILQLLEHIRAERNISYLFVHHDLAVAQRMCSRIIVMRDGSVVVSFDSSDFAHVNDPYVAQLRSAIFTLDD